jgi:F-type H+-transporting ATPase subunit epsilon
MSRIGLDFVSQDHMVFSGDVGEVIAPGFEGQLAILPKHAPLITVLSPGEVVVRCEGMEDLFFAVSGGWMEVRPDKITILARTAERSDEIDLQRAEAARARAADLLAESTRSEERPRLESALRRSQIRLKVGRRRGRARSEGPGPTEDFGEQGK